MKRLLYIVAIAVTTTLTACHNDDDDKLPNVMPQNTGTVTDDDGNEYNWVQIGNLCWTTSNAKNGEDMYSMEYVQKTWTSYVFSSSSKAYVRSYQETYGNLMTYADAVESAPEGWRLPTDEDWKNLERALGMSHVDDKGWRGTDQARLLMQKDEGTCLNFLTGGAILWNATTTALRMELDFEGVYGYYWTATQDPDTETNYTYAYYRKIPRAGGQVYRASMREDRACSVRWVRDAK